MQATQSLPLPQTGHWQPTIRMFPLFACVIKSKGVLIMSATFFIRRREAARKAREEAETGKNATEKPQNQTEEAPGKKSKKAGK